MESLYKYIQVRVVDGNEQVINVDDTEEQISHPVPGDRAGDGIYMLIGTFKDVSKVQATLKYVPEEDED